MPENFLSSRERRTWKVADAPDGVEPIAWWPGNGDYRLEVALARANRRPRAQVVRELWRTRQRGGTPVELVVLYPAGGETRAAICGPMGPEPPVIPDLDLEQAERLMAAALDAADGHAAFRLLLESTEEASSALPGIVNQGLLAVHDLVNGVPSRPDWQDACERAAPLLDRRGRSLVEGLGYRIEQRETLAAELLVGERRRALAVFLDEREEFDRGEARFDGQTPVSYALAVAHTRGLPWVVVTRGSRIRLYSSDPNVGVGRRGRSLTYVQLDLAQLPSDSAGYLDLLLSARALKEGGTLEELLGSSARFAVALGERLRDRVYFEAVPRLATAIAARHGAGGRLTEPDLSDAYEQTLVTLFRILFVAYGEDRGLLPYETNGAYRDHSLKELAKRLAVQAADPDHEPDEHGTDVWDDVQALWTAVALGRDEWGVPEYGGSLFASDPEISPAGAALAGLRLTNAEFEPALTALLVDETAEGGKGPVDFRSLSVREFGTIYEGLLESELAIAPSDLTLDRDGAYVPAGEGDAVVVPAEAVYFHNRSGTRKATGSYFTKPFAVEHLLEHALEPALDAHLKRVKKLLAAGDDAAAAQAFFDFRCADIAMGSGHFLVAAVDHIEARLSDFLTREKVPYVQRELEELRAEALRKLGPLADGVEIESASLLRRLVARRCIYGVDLNLIAVELARLGLWIHTFVPGLPLSFLDRNLVVGNSLTGVATIDEAVEALDPEHAGQISMLREPLEEFLARAEPHLKKLAAIADATTAEIEEARAAAAEATAALEPLSALLDLIVAARLGTSGVSLPDHVDEERVLSHPALAAARQRADELHALHFPVAFPEVFLRERAGFDCIIGNPPWEEATVEELKFWSLRFPGLNGLPTREREQRMAEFKDSRPDLVSEYEKALAEAELVRAVLTRGPFPGMGTGDPDLYKAFSWRFWHLCREDGRVGVVLPRSVLAAKGSQEWRREILEHGSFEDVTTLLNTAGWVFDEAEHRYTVALVGLRRAEGAGFVRLRGPYASPSAYERGLENEPASFSASEFASWSEAASFPLLPDDESVEIFKVLRAHPSLAAAPALARPVAELHATNDRKLFDAEDKQGYWPVFTGSSFNLWEPDTGEYYGWADPDVVTEALHNRRLRQQRLARSAFSAFPREWVQRRDTLPCFRARVAFRDVTNRTNQRTVIAALVPPSVVLVNQAPYLLFANGDERNEAYLLGLLSSIPLDWYARRYVETHVNFFVLNSFPIPRPPIDDPLRRAVVEASGRLAAADERFDEWAAAVGVPVASVTSEEERDDLIALIDAAVAHLYGLDEAKLTHLFETFHVGWDFAPRLERVLDHFHRLEKAV